MLTGKSRVRIGGKYLHVSGLLWKDTEAVDHAVAFRIDSKTLAEHCQLVECAIIGDVPGGDRKWVSLYGKKNTVSHCRFEEKQSAGTLLVVWLNDEPNRHNILWNFFGPRQRLGKNGGETIRVGDSQTSLNTSQTTVAYNYFYRCDGEAEIISNKSCENHYVVNTFVGCGGALTLRHGNRCLVQGNSFYGDGRKGTGGVRVIGEQHQIAGNLFYELQGDDGRAALSLMNGLPNTPLNGYAQVLGTGVSGNWFIRCKQNIVVGLADRDQKTQTLPPQNSTFDKNIVISSGAPVFDVREANEHPLDDKSSHMDNLFTGEKCIAVGDDRFDSGWSSVAELTFRFQPDGSPEIVERPERKIEERVSLKECGPAWMRPANEFLPAVLREKQE